MATDCKTSADPCSVEMLYDVGDKPRINAYYTDKNSKLPIDPDTVKLIINSPQNQWTYEYGLDAEIYRPSTGVYHCLVALTEPGKWHFRWEATGHGASAQEFNFGVRDVGPTDCPSDYDQFSDQLKDALSTPKKVQGDEGSVEERSISELIEADRYLAYKQEAKSPLHGIRLGRVKPNGTV